MIIVSTKSQLFMNNVHELLRWFLIKISYLMLQNVRCVKKYRNIIRRCNDTSTTYVLLPLITPCIDSSTFSFLPVANTQLRFLHENNGEQYHLQRK